MSKLVGYKKGETSLDLNDARDDGGFGWQWHQLDHMQTICTSLQTNNHTNTSSLNTRCPSCRPTVKVLKAQALTAPGHVMHQPVSVGTRVTFKQR